MLRAMVESDPFTGLEKALTELRLRAGLKTKLAAAAKIGIDKGQLSRWERGHRRPSLEMLGRVLAGYGATMADLAALLGGEAEPKLAAGAGGEPPPKVEDPGPTDEELIRALTDAIRRVEGRLKATDFRVARLEEELG
ncbi:MAG TPA: helix-turn-helix transcriptional regulator [Thermoanaerobaculia bacterium]|nr:helix-turn-helix transcriptional regulator [Thermoanaerobaculia bacterium]